MSSPQKPSADAFAPIDSHVSIGHVHLKVADLERALSPTVGSLVLN